VQSSLELILVPSSDHWGPRRKSDENRTFQVGSFNCNSNWNIYIVPPYWKTKGASQSQHWVFVVAETETAESQHSQAEEHSNKLKQMLLKTKKDLADAKKLVLLSALSGW